jgi:hypothetical protein
VGVITDARHLRRETLDTYIQTVIRTGGHVTRGPRRPGALQLALLLGLVTTALARGQTSAPPAPVNAAAIGSSLSPTLLRDLPASDNLFSLLETTEGEVTSDRFYGGGLNTGRAARDGAFLNSWTQTQFFVGDVNVTVPDGGAHFLFPTLALWDRVDVATGLMPPGVNAPGLAISLQPARPAASWARMVEASASGGALVAGPAASGPPAIERLRNWTHGGLFVSGPLSPRAGLVAAAEWAGASQVERTGVAQAGGQAASLFAHLVFTPNAADEIRTVGWVQRTQAPFAGAAAFGRPLAADQTTYTHVQSTWERHRADAMAWRLFGAYSQRGATRADSAVAAPPAVPPVPIVERLIDGPVPLLADSGDRTDRQWSFGARAVTPPRARGGLSHTLFAGVDVGRASARVGPGFAGAIGELVDGNRARMWQYSNAGVDAHRHATSVTAFLSDRIGFGPGRTLEAGVGYDGVDGMADLAAAGVSWHSVLPRVSLRWKRRESSNVTLIAGYRRSVDRLTMDTLAVGDPSASTAEVSRWTARGVGPVVARVGPGTGGAPTFSAIDPSLDRPTTDEVVAGIDVQLTPAIRVRLVGVAKQLRHLFDFVDAGAPPSSYTVFTVVDGRPEADGGDVLLPVYNRLPSSFGADRYLLTNSTGQDAARFEGLVLNAEASMNRLTVLLNATASQTDGPAVNRSFHAEENDLGAFGELSVDPNATPSARGRLFYDRAFTIKLSGVYKFPHDVTLGAIARYQDGQPFSRVTVVPDLNQGTEFVRAFPAGDSRFKFTGTLDVRLQKRVPVGAKSLDVFVDAYNALNLGYEVEERVVTGGRSFRDITAIQPPVVVHVGLRLGF